MILEEFRIETPDYILKIADEVWANKDMFVRWPNTETAHLFIDDMVRRRGFQDYTPDQTQRILAAGLIPDRRNNGPAIMAYRMAGGDRPMRMGTNRGWSIHHVYDGKFPARGRDATVRAVNDGGLFTHAAGLVAVHPIADALADEVPYFAWLLRREAFERFGFDPDFVFR